MRKLGQRLPVFMMLLFSFVVLIRPQTPSKQTTAPRTILSPTRAANLITSPEDVGLSSERLERIANTIQRNIDDGRISGAVTLVARHGKLAHLKAFGMADRETKKPMRTDNIFRICSMTKPITSVAVMMLYEEGRFMLNEPVSNFIPEFKNMKVLEPPFSQDKTSPPGALVDAKRPITIRHLLTHTAGLTYHWNARLGKKYREVSVGHGLLQQEGTIGDAVKKWVAGL